jgi:two-component system cell cycle sensor histidine kinase/response regulator CckA
MTDNSQRGLILIVDDDFDICRFTRLFLEDAGYTVVTAADGQEAFRLYQEHQSSVALLLTDVVMPNLNGRELADRVLAMDSQLPVLLMSGDQACDHGNLEFLAKPIRPAELIETVRRMLNANTRSERRASAA